MRPDRRARYLTLLRDDGPRSVAWSFDDSSLLDARWLHPIPRSEQFAGPIGGLLVDRGAPRACYVIGGPDDLDGRTVELRAALEAIVGAESAVLVCIPGVLCYFEGHEPNDRFILQRHPDAAGLRAL